MAAIHSPMQCMMKEICGQCLQAQTDPETGESRIVFTCAHQDQDMDAVDFVCLKDRLKQDRVQETLTARWIARLTDRMDAV